MDRRRFLLTSLAGALAAPLGAGAQQTGKVPHIGVILPGSAGVSVDTVAAIKEGLRSHGLVEGRSITIDWYFADGKYDQLPAATEKLLKDGATLLVVGGTTPAMIVNKTTVSKPIVFAGVSDPVGALPGRAAMRPVSPPRTRKHTQRRHWSCSRRLSRQPCEPVCCITRGTHSMSVS